MIEFERTDDPLLRDVPLEHHVELPVLGIPVEYRTNSPDVLAVIEESYGSWRVLEDRPQLLQTDPVQVTVIVYGDGEDVSPADRTATEGRDGDAPRHLNVQYRVPDVERIYVTAPGCMGVTDARRREAIAYVTPALVSDREHFRYTFISGLTMGLLSPLDRQPLHAAALVRAETALLLAGPSGTGKSTLCYAGALNGFSVLSDDHVNLQRHPCPRVWGMPGHLHLPLDAREHFPALAQSRATLLSNGKEKIAINLREMGAEAPLPVVERAGVCVLTRTGEGPTLMHLSAEELQTRLLASPDPTPRRRFTVPLSPTGRLTVLSLASSWISRTGSTPGLRTTGGLFPYESAQRLPWSRVRSLRPVPDGNSYFPPGLRPVGLLADEGHGPGVSCRSRRG